MLTFCLTDFLTKYPNLTFSQMADRVTENAEPRISHGPAALTGYRPLKCHRIPGPVVSLSDGN